jgi:hypothetical protein
MQVLLHSRCFSDGRAICARTLATGFLLVRQGEGQRERCSVPPYSLRTRLVDQSGLFNLFRWRNDVPHPPRGGRPFLSISSMIDFNCGLYGYVLSPLRPKFLHLPLVLVRVRGRSNPSVDDS